MLNSSSKSCKSRFELENEESREISPKSSLMMNLQIDRRRIGLLLKFCR